VPFEFTDRWIQLVEGDDFDAEVFAHVPGGGEKRKWGDLLELMGEK
jgi:hypothetical protein